MNTGENLFFWKNWPRTICFLYIFLLALIVGVMVYAAMGYFNGFQNIAGWETITSIETSPIVIDVFSVSIFNVEVKAENFLTEKIFSVKDIHISALYPTLFIVIVFLAASVLTTVVTFLKRIYFLVGMTLVVLFLALLKLDILGVFGWYNNYFFLVYTGVVLLTAFYFQNINQRISFFIRWISFFGIFLTLLAVVLFFSHEQNPFSYIANYGLIIPFIVTAIFIFLVAHEVVYSFASITNASGSRYASVHFLVVSLVYLGNLFLVYLKNTNQVNWNFYSIDPFLLLGISIIIGFVGFKQKTQSGGMGFYPTGAFFYISLALVAISTIAYLWHTANDPMIEALEDVIVYSHIGMGIMCALYTFSNFAKSFSIHRTVALYFYKPSRFSFQVARVGGVVVVLAFFFKSSYFSFYQSIAGYYNNIGDTYLTENNLPLAQSYYRLGAQYEFQNHKSNYSLADLFCRSQKEDIAIFYLKRALVKQPTIQAYIKLAGLFSKNNLFFESLFTLKEGIKKFPQSPELYTNLASLYNKTNILDSAYIYLQQARHCSSTKDMMDSNLLFFWSKHAAKLSPNIDSILQASSLKNYLPYASNRVAFYNMLRRSTSVHEDTLLIQNKPISSSLIGYIHNASLNNLYHAEKKGIWIPVLHRLEKQSSDNQDYLQELKLLEALQYYHIENKRKALSLLQQVSAVEKYALYDELMGLWLLEQQASQAAVAYFQKAIEGGRRSSSLIYQAIALTEAGRSADAIECWKIISNEVLSMKNLSTSMVHILNSREDTSLIGKLACVRYSNKSVDEKEKLIASITSTETQAMAWNMFFKEYVIHHDDRITEKLIRHLSLSLNPSTGKHEPSTSSQQQLLYIYGQWLFNKQDWKELENFIQNTLWNSNQVIEHWQAMCYINRHELQNVDSLFTKALEKAPLNSDVIESARLFYNGQHQAERAYQFIWDAIRLNPYDVKLYESYILQCFVIGIEKYADEGMVHLSTIASATEFKRFTMIYQKEKEKWNNVDW